MPSRDSGDPAAPGPAWQCSGRAGRHVGPRRHRQDSGSFGAGGEHRVLTRLASCDAIGVERAAPPGRHLRGIPMSSTLAPRRRRRDAASWLAGFATALTGDQLFYLALTWAAAQVLPPIQVGLLLVCGAVPRALVLLFGGVLVDRAGPKPVIMLSDSARTLIMAAAAVVVLVSAPGPLLLVVLVVGFGVVDGFFLPAVGAVPAFVVAPQSMARLQAVRSVVYRGAPMLGAAIGGWLVAYGSFAGALALAAGLFALSVLALAVTRMVVPVAPAPEAPVARPDPGTSPSGSTRRLSTKVAAVLAQVLEGLRTAAADPFLRVAIPVVTLLDLGLVGPSTAGPALVATARHWGPEAAGAMLAATPAGATVCAVVLIVRRPAARAGSGIVAGVALTSVGLLGIGLAVVVDGAQGFALAVGSCALVGVAIGLYGTMIHTALLQLTPAAQLGRVVALVALASYVADPVSLAATGLLEGRATGSSFIVGGLVVGVAALLAASSSSVRSAALNISE